MGVRITESARYEWRFVDDLPNDEGVLDILLNPIPGREAEVAALLLDPKVREFLEEKAGQ
jgi:hypothetical protein